MLNPVQFQVLTFDCYGTLIDWETGLWAALEPIFARYKINIEQEAALQLYGELESALEAGPYLAYKTVVATVLGQLGQRLGFTPNAEETAEFGLSVKQWPAFADSPAALQRLQQRYKLAIISNVDDDLFAASEQRLGVKFDWIITAQQVQSYKPSLNNFQQAFERLALPQSAILHVAQSLFHDIVPANQLGLNTVWVNRRHANPGFGATPAAEAQPDLVVPSLAALADALGC
ncbi:haloacid dehalogenase type II [Herpetosiphon gulosus]|uniref:(S)-2-haloacid dehalogenase n=1 Tax=Herpetosiphon gulosus TaxID=1973496 RepID=A0ABP9WZE8_9CHLR